MFVMVAATSSLWAGDLFYFRPKAGGPYGDSSGTSYNNAWHLDDTAKDASGNPLPGAVDWSKLSAGDTLFVGGLHDGGYQDRCLAPTKTGIYINGRCPKFGGGYDPGVILAAGAKFTGGWTQHAAYSDVYQRNYGGSTASQMLERNAEEQLIRLRRASRPPDGTWEPGTFYQAGPGQILYYKPTSGSANDRTVYTRSDTVLRIHDVNNVRIKNLKLLNANRLIEIKNAEDVLVRDCELQWASYAGITVEQGSDGGEIDGVEIHDVANGIYFLSSQDATNSNNWLIRDSEIHHVDQEFYYENSDSHAIGIQGGDNNCISGNELHHIGGTGVTIYTFVDQKAKNNIICYNYIHDVKDLADAGRRAWGIEYGNSNNNAIDPDDTLYNKVYYNILVDIDKIGIYTKASNPSTGRTWTYVNNLIYRAGRGFVWEEYSNGDPGFLLANNIFLDPTSGIHIDQVAFQPGDEHAGVSIKNNLFWPSQSFVWNGTAYSNYYSWAAIAGISGTNLLGEPMFENLLNGAYTPGFGSPVVNGGINVGLTRDYNGNNIVGDPDIGPIEYQESTP